MSVFDSTPRIHAAKTFSDASKQVDAARSALKVWRSATIHSATLVEMMNRAENPNEKAALKSVLETSRDASVEANAKTEVWRAYRAIVGRIVSQLDSFKFEEMREMDDNETLEMLEHAEKLLSDFRAMFPQVASK